MTDKPPGDEFDFPERRAIRAGQRRLQILALPVGGYRGLYTAAILEHLEELAGSRLAEKFDLIAGTSIGGILAIGIAAGVPMASIRAAFAANGSNIFAKASIAGPYVMPRWRFGLLRERYSPKGLAATIDQVLGAADGAADTAALRADLMVCAVNVTLHQPHVFRSYFGSPVVRLRDVALATSAAPTYFPEHRIGQHNFVDGGLIANAPDILAIHDAIRAGFTREEIRVLSIGTDEGEEGQTAREPGGAGALTDAKRLFQLTLDAQQSLAIDQSRALLTDRNFLRIDATASAAQITAIGLDRTDTMATETLLALAKGTIEDQLGTKAGQLRELFNHTPSRL